MSAVRATHHVAPNFGVGVTRRGSSVLVELVGELDIAGEAGLRRELLEACLLNTRLLIVDLRSLTFMGSTGIRLLLELDAASRADGMDLVVVQGPPPVQRVLELTGLDKRLCLVEHRDHGGLWTG